MTNTCKTCVHWDKVSASLSAMENVGGICQSEKFSDYSMDFPPDGLVYSYNEGGVFWTGPDFGCVHHKARE